MRPDSITECWLMLHVLNEDWPAAQTILDAMNGTERRALYEAIRRIKGALIEGRFHSLEDAPEPFPRALAGEQQ